MWQLIALYMYIVHVCNFCSYMYMYISVVLVNYKTHFSKAFTKDLLVSLIQF